MSDDNECGCNPESYDGIELNGAEEFLPPHQSDLLEATETAVAEMLDESIRAITETLDWHLGDMAKHLSDISMAFGGEFGKIDNELRKYELEMWRAVDRRYDLAYRAILDIERDLVTNGIGVPISPHEMEADLNDSSGERIMERLAGNSDPIPFDRPIMHPGPLPGANGDTRQPIPDRQLPGVQPCDLSRIVSPFQIVTEIPAGYTDVGIVFFPYDSPPSADLSRYHPGTIMVVEGYQYDAGILDGRVISPPGCNFRLWSPYSAPSPPPPPTPEPLPPPPPTPPPEPENPLAACELVPMKRVEMFVPCDDSPVMPVPVSPPPSPPKPTESEPRPFEAIQPWTTPGLNWGASNACEQVNIDIANAKPKLAPASTTPDQPGWVREVESTWVYQGIDWIGKNWQGFWDSMSSSGEYPEEVLDEFQKEGGRVLGSTAFGTVGLSFIAQHLNSAAVPNWEAAAKFGVEVQFARRVEDKTGFPASYLMQSRMYEYQYANPQFIPGQADIDLMYLTDKISFGFWNCYTAAQGNIPSVFQESLYAKAAKPNISELIQLHLRGHIDWGTLLKRARELGVLDPSHTNEWFQLHQQVPNPTDLVSWMKRDAADPAVVAQYNYDKDFANKFTPQMAAWAGAQGYDSEFMRMAWRSHWQIPSNTALYEIRARYRFDRPEVEQWMATWGQTPQTYGPVTNVHQGVAYTVQQPLVITEKDIQTAMEINDMAPTWVDPVVGISERPITNTDARRAYEIGFFTETDLYHAMRDNMYGDATAQKLVGFFKAQKARTTANQSGVWSVRKIMTAYREGTINGVQADQLLTPIVPDVARRNQMIAGADTEVAAQNRKIQMRSIKKHYLTGYTDFRTTELTLINIGIAVGRTADIMLQWTAERNGRLKEPTVRMISRWVREQIITIDDGMARLLNLGYERVDAEKILIQAIKEEYEKQVKKVEQAKKELLKEYKNTQEAKKATQKELEDRYKAIVKEMERIQKELEKRQG